MNAAPHTHEVEVERYYSSIQAGCWVVRYGDTKVNVHRGPMLERRIARATRRAVKKHDRGSVRAGQKTDATAHLTVVARRAASSEWAAPTRGELNEGAV